MNPEVKKIGNKLFDKVELASQKVDLAAIDDFKEIYNKANNEQAKIATTLVDNLAKASNDFKGNLADWQKASVIGNQIILKAKELGVELPAPFLNSVKASEIEVKNTPSVLSNISKLYSVF